MIRLDTYVLSSNGKMRAPLGAFLQPGDGYCPWWRDTLACDGEIGRIEGATVLNYDILDHQGAIEVTVDGREKAPLIAAPGTKVWSCDEGGWRQLRELRVFETLRIPTLGVTGLVPTWAKVKKIQTATHPERIFLGTPRVWGNLKLGRGAYSYATPSAFVRVRQ